MNRKALFALATFFVLACQPFLTRAANSPFEVKISGTGTQCIVFIPGFACSGKVWSETIKQYESRYTCYVFTMAGFAGVPAQGPITFDSWTEGVAEYIRENNMAHPILIGHSMGGALALAIAAKYPALASKVVVVDALPCLAALMKPDFKPLAQPDCKALADQLTAMTAPEFYQMQKMSIPYLLADTSHRAEVIQWSVNSDRHTFAAMYCDFSNTDLREKIGAIQCPVWVLLEAPFAQYKKPVSEQYKALKNVRLEYAGKGLHFIMFDDTDWYNSQLKTILNP
jgi:pimeloyl-ACP methyl ester carboxylesterase